MEAQQALKLIREIPKTRHLTTVEVVVLQGVWEGLSYSEIAVQAGYDTGYIKNVSSSLWQSLADILEEKVTKTNLQAVLKRYSLKLQPVETLTTKQTASSRQDWQEAVDTPVFFGRTAELAKLKQWIVEDRCRLVTLFGLAGIGKTSLAAQMAQQIQPEFDYIIWRSLRQAPSVSDILRQLLQFLSPQASDLPTTLNDQLLLLLKYIRLHRCLLILDQVESVLCSEQPAGNFRSGDEGYSQLISCVAQTAHQSCLVLLSREQLRGVATYTGILPTRDLQLIGLNSTDAEKIIKLNGLSGTVEDQRKLIECYQGNPLALKIAATSIQLLSAGRISEFLEQGIIVSHRIMELSEQQISRLTNTEKQIIYYLALEQEPVTLLKLQIDLSQFTKPEILESLESLCRRSLLERNVVDFTLQSTIKEYIVRKTSSLI